jgi:hypothetical protein
MARQILGLGNGSGASATVNEMYFELFAGEVLAEFGKTVVAMPRVRQRALPKGAKSVSFPKLASVSAIYHDQGENIITDSGTNEAGSAANYQLNNPKGETIIYADKLLLSSVLIDRLDEVLSAYDARAEYSRLLGRAIGERMDRQIFRAIGKAANAAAGLYYTSSPSNVGQLTVAIGSGGYLSSQTTAAAVTAADIVNWAFNVKNDFDTYGVPQEGRTIALPPLQYTKILKAASSGGSGVESIILNSDWAGRANGGVADGVVMRLAGFDIVMTNNLPTTTDTTNKLVTGEGNDYNPTLTKCVGMAWHQEAVGVVKAMDLAVESEYKIEYQADILVAKMAAGVGTLRPECAALLLYT